MSMSNARVHGPAGLLLLFLTLLPAGVEAQTRTIDETRSLRSGGSVEIKALSHNVRVESWNRNEIHISGSYDEAVEEVMLRGTEQSLRFEIRAIGSHRGSRTGSRELRVQVPADVRISVNTLSGNIEVTGVTGSVAGHTLSGRLEVSGNLDRVELNSMSGNASYRGNADVVRIRSVSGSLTLDGAAGEVELVSVSGSIDLDGGWERAEIQSVSGTVSATSSRPVRSLRINSVSGSTTFRGALADGARVDLEVHSGRIDLTVPQGTNARWDLSSFSGRMDVSLANLRDEQRSQSRFTPEQSHSFTTGTGSGRVDVRTFSGSVVVRGNR